MEGQISNFSLYGMLILTSPDEDGKQLLLNTF